MPTTNTAAVEATDTVTEGMLLLFELENLAFAGRKKLYDLLKKNVAAIGVQLNTGNFSRYGIKPTPEQAVASLAEGVGNGKGDAAKIGADVNAAYVAELREKLDPTAAVTKFLTAAAKKGFHLGALSSLAPDDADVVFKRLALGTGARLHAHKPDEASYPRAESWLKLVKTITKASLPAIALVSSQAACKSALAAGLRVIVLPDEYTSYQDFGGADIVVDSASELNISEIMTTLGV